MIVIKSTQKTMQSVGLLFTSNETLSYKIYRWISFTILSILFEPSCLYLLENYQDLIKATEVCIYIAAEGVMIVKAIFMFYNQKMIRHLLEDLQIMANEKIRIGRDKFLYKFDGKADQICKYFLGMLSVAICIWSGGPLAAIFYRSATGTYVPHTYGHPFKGSFPFDYKTTPGYEITYAVNIIYNIYLATYFAACDLFFVSCGMHLIGATQDLEQFLKEIDIEVHDIIDQKKKKCISGVNVVWKSIPMQERAQLHFNIQLKLREAIKSHYEILRLTDNLAAIEQGIIFIEIFGVLFSLSAIAFQMVISKGEQQFFFIGPTVVILCQLFLYCYYGQRITDQALHLCESVYQLNWYNYPIKFQKYLQIIILRSQNTRHFSGFGFVYCSLESFTAVLKFVGSVVALFRNLET